MTILGKLLGSVTPISSLRQPVYEETNGDDVSKIVRAKANTHASAIVLNLYETESGHKRFWKLAGSANVVAKTPIEGDDTRC